MAITTVGILALQGDFQKHAEALERLKVCVRQVKSQEELQSADALVIPGGESTTIGKLLVRFGLLRQLAASIEEGLPVFGTCAGLILLAGRIIGYNQPSLSVLDVAVARNAYGSQVMSFETDLSIPVLGTQPLRAVFIRAPIIKAIGPEVEVLASFEGNPVLVRQKQILAASFHPELTDDLRLHQYFLNIAEEAQGLRAEGLRQPLFR